MKKEEILAVIGLGSNLGDRLNNLRKAYEELQVLPQVRLLKTSNLCSSEAWGKKDQPDFLNVAVSLMTTLDAEELMRVLIGIEEKLGRVRSEKWGPRIIDLDLLFYGREMFRSATLVVPHPHLHERKFVLMNLMSLDKQFIHPSFNRSVEELFNSCTDPLRADDIGIFEIDK